MLNKFYQVKSGADIYLTSIPPSLRWVRPVAAVGRRKAMLWTSGKARNSSPDMLVKPIDGELCASLITVGSLAKEAL
jgi:hypothetical protein